MTADGNGHSKLPWWIIGAFLGPLVMMVFGLTVNTAYQHGQRVSVLEAEAGQTVRRLDRIERKLDLLLERR